LIWLDVADNILDESFLTHPENVEKKAMCSKPEAIKIDA